MAGFTGISGSFGNVPPAGTSAHKAYQAATSRDPGASSKPYSFSPASSSGASLYSSPLSNTTLGSASSGKKSLDSIYGPGVRPWDPPGSSGGSGSQPQAQDYLDAPWASAYGMSKETAYNEAMTNTEYRRAVKDMQAAGLNPAVIFGAGKGSTAGVPGYIRSASYGGGGGGGGGSYSRRSGSGSSKDRLFSSSAYSVLTVLGGVAGAVATKSASGYWLGASVMQGSMNALDALSRWKR